MRILVIAAAFALLTGCSNDKPVAEGEAKKVAAEGTYGEVITDDGSITVDQLIAEMGNKPEIQAKVKGKIVECCQVKGCWMNIEKSDGSLMRVTFKDYGFFVPKDVSGKTAIMQGRAYYDTLSVEMQRHYAEDAGNSPAEINRITEPKTELTFEADGVLIR
jgi:hypothetical protein